MGETYRLTKIAVAVDQLDWAIRLLIDHSAYIPAVALAGAAEEILGRFVGQQASFHVLKSTLAVEHGLTESEIADGHLNHLRNWIKHFDSNDKANTSLDFERADLEAVSIQMIARALHNLAVHDGTGPSELPRFTEWLGRTRPDLL